VLTRTSRGFDYFDSVRRNFYAIRVIRGGAEARRRKRTSLRTVGLVSEEALTPSREHICHALLLAAKTTGGGAGLVHAIVSTAAITCHERGGRYLESAAASRSMKLAWARSPARRPPRYVPWTGIVDGSGKRKALDAMTGRIEGGGYSAPFAEVKVAYHNGRGPATSLLSHSWLVMPMGRAVEHGTRWRSAWL